MTNIKEGSHISAHCGRVDNPSLQKFIITVEPCFKNQNDYLVWFWHMLSLKLKKKNFYKPIRSLLFIIFSNENAYYLNPLWSLYLEILQYHHFSVTHIILKGNIRKTWNINDEICRILISRSDLVIIHLVNK